TVSSALDGCEWYQRDQRQRLGVGMPARKDLTFLPGQTRTRWGELRDNLDQSRPGPRSRGAVSGAALHVSRGNTPAALRSSLRRGAGTARSLDRTLVSGRREPLRRIRGGGGQRGRLDGV